MEFIEGHIISQTNKPIDVKLLNEFYTNEKKYYFI